VKEMVSMMAGYAEVGKSLRNFKENISLTDTSASGASKSAEGLRLRATSLIH